MSDSRPDFDTYDSLTTAHPGRGLRSQDDVHRLNFAWLIRLRWVAFIGQSGVIITAALMLDIDFPYLILASILLVEVLSNLALIAWARTGRPRHEALGALVLIADIVFLTALLYFTGGANNPFSLLYFIHVALAALILKPLWTWGVTLLSVGAFIGLYFFHYPTQYNPWAAPHDIGSLETQGKWVAFVVSAAVLAFFINMIQKALTRRDEELIRVRDAQMRNEKLASLATLAAGAAHEFSTPLSTIALVASELQRGLEKEDLPSHYVDDAELIRSQVERCRDILRQMSADAGESLGEFARPVGLTELIDHTLEGCRDISRVRVSIETDRRAELTVPPTALGQALRGLVNNGLEASAPDQFVDVVARARGEEIVVEISDRGTGMAPEVLSRAAEPFFTTKEAGQGMGLGIFLARTLVEKINGRLELSSTPGKGTVATVVLPGTGAAGAALAPKESKNAEISANGVTHG